MNPIINPWWYYFVTRLTGIKVVLILVAIVLGLVALFTFIDYLTELDFRSVPEELKKRKLKTVKYLSIIVLVCGVLGVFIPSEKTMHTMLALKHLTPNNIEAAGNDVKDAIDYIFEKIEELDKEEK